MQKAVRRGEAPIALAAAATYLALDATGFWRRLPIIAAEDIGIGDWDLATTVFLASANEKWRQICGGDWPIASLLIERMCDCPKERGTAALTQAALTHPGAVNDCVNLGGCGTPELLKIVQDCSMALETRAIAAWYVLGTTSFRGTQLVRRRGDPAALFSTFEDMGVPPKLVGACQLASSRGRYPLAAFLPLLWLAIRRSTPPAISVRETGPTRTSRGIPLYALDKHTSAGKRAIRAFAATNLPLRRVFDRYPPIADNIKAVELAVFHAEGVCLRRQLTWDETERLSSLELEADLAPLGIRPEAMVELIRAVEENLWDLDRARMAVLTGEQIKHGMSVERGRP